MFCHVFFQVEGVKRKREGVLEQRKRLLRDQTRAQQVRLVLKQFSVGDAAD